MDLSLVGNPYVGISPIASAQKAVNLYAASNNGSNAPTPITYYPTAGSTTYTFTANQAAVRCAYRTTLGTAFVVIGPTVYFLANNGALVFVGTIADRPNQVYMADNGLCAVLVDGTSTGYAIDLTTNNFGVIIDPSFYGADFVLFLDTFFVFNRPATNQFYISLSMVSYALLTAGTSFDPLDIAAKSGSADPIVGIATVHKELWLIGALTTEVWIGTGAADFYFQLQQGAYIDHGCAAPYSITTMDVIVFWIMQDRQGSCMIVQGAGYETKEISTPYLVNQLKNYATVADAIGFCWQYDSQSFFVLVFPTANKTWQYNLKTGYWNELTWLNVDTGIQNRHRSNCAMFVYGKNIYGDWQNGKLYELDANIYNDDGTPVIRQKTFAHLLNEMCRISYDTFQADVSVGNSDPGVEYPISLLWSDNRGVSYGFPVEQTLGSGGEYQTSVEWDRLGMARDRVFMLQWSADVKIALNGAYSNGRKHLT